MCVCARRMGTCAHVRVRACACTLGRNAVHIGCFVTVLTCLAECLFSSGCLQGWFYSWTGRWKRVQSDAGELEKWYVCASGNGDGHVLVASPV